MTILGIETSTAVCSVGLANETGAFAEKSIVESHIHSEKLLTLIKEICEGNKISLAALDGIAISIGPGSFTGLRIGLSTAKGLCFALSKPLFTVETFVAIARGALQSYNEYKKVAICIDAKQGEYYIGIYEVQNGSVIELKNVSVESLNSININDLKSTLLVTDKIEEVKKVVKSNNEVRDVFQFCRGDNVAYEATRFSKGTFDSWGKIEPKYLKDFVIKKQMLKK